MDDARENMLKNQENSMINTATATELWRIRLKNGRTFDESLPSGLEPDEVVALVKQRWPDLAQWHLDATMITVPF
jgi:hypothetical protein